MSTLLAKLLMMACLSSIVVGTIGCSGGDNEPLTGPPLVDPEEDAKSAEVPRP